MWPNTRRIQAKWNQVRRDTRARGTTTDCSADAAVSTTIAEPATTAATRTPTTVSRWQMRTDGGDQDPPPRSVYGATSRKSLLAIGTPAAS